MSNTYSNGKVLLPIHKNASTWLRNMLNQILGEPDRQNAKERWKASYYNTQTVIVFVRNPWDRVLSGYLYTKKHWSQEKEYGPFPDYSIYLQEIEKMGIGKAPWQSFQRQYDYIDMPIADLFFFGHYENLYDDFTRLCEKMEVKPPDSKIFQYYHNRNGNTSRDGTGGPTGYRDYYTDETKKIIERIYQKDIEKFEYSF